MGAKGRIRRACIRVSGLEKYRPWRVSFHCFQESERSKLLLYPTVGQIKMLAVVRLVALRQTPRSSQQTENRPMEATWCRDGQRAGAGTQTNPSPRSTCGENGAGGVQKRCAKRERLRYTAVGLPKRRLRADLSERRQRLRLHLDRLRFRPDRNDLLGSVSTAVHIAGTRKHQRHGQRCDRNRRLNHGVPQPRGRGGKRQRHEGGQTGD